MLLAVLDPNQAVEDRYVAYVAATLDGRSFNGMLASETGTSITLRGPDGKEQVILRNQLDEMRSTGKSLMPEGLEKDVTVEQLADLFAYLAVFRPRAEAFPGNKPETVRPEADGSLQLLASNGAVHGKTLVFEAKHKNLGYWQSADDRAVWTVQRPRAGRYAVTLAYSGPKEKAGNEYVTEAGGERLTGKVTATDSWDDYRSRSVGENALAVYGR